MPVFYEFCMKMQPSRGSGNRLAKAQGTAVVWFEAEASSQVRYPFDVAIAARRISSLKANRRNAVNQASARIYPGASSEHALFADQPEVPVRQYFQKYPGDGRPFDFQPARLPKDQDRRGESG